MGKNRTYDKEFKIDSVQYLLNNPDKSVTEVAESLGVRRDALSRWKHEFLKDKDKSFPGKGIPKDQEFMDMKKQLLQAKEENEILKKALAIFSRGQK